MAKDFLTPFSEAIQSLHKLCAQGQTGSMYIFTDDGHGAIFAVVKGKIVDFFYRSIRGPKALQLMRSINTAKYFFKKDPNVRSRESDCELSNDEIFQSIGVDLDALSGAPASQKTKGKKKILAVEDSAIARKAIVEALAGEDYEVVEAKDGFEALGKLGEEIPDMVLLDLILPKMDGYEVLAAMKKDNDYKNIPVIVLTSRSTLFDKLKGKMSGIDEYLTKPFKAQDLRNKLDQYLS